jgi:hypothetical protein
MPTADLSDLANDLPAVADCDFGLIRWLQFALNDQTNVFEAGNAVFTTRFPACEILAVRASVQTASTTGELEFDINIDGVSIFSTPLTIDQTETTSTTAAVPAVISTTTVPDDSQITFDIVDAGDGNAIGAIITMEVRWT